MNTSFAVLFLTLLFACFYTTFAQKPTWNEIQHKEYSFTEYLKHHNKHYENFAEFLTRKSLFETSLSKIRAHNANPSFTWKLNVNHMSDWTEQERKSILGYKKQLTYQSRFKELSSFRAPFPSTSSLAYDFPRHKDWRMEGVVSAVKDQGHCGSCWSFAAAETLESHHALKTGDLFVLSQQQILDCTPNPDQCGGSGGCNGGTVELAFERIVNKTGGLSSEWTYPYTSYFGDNFTCNFDTKKTIPVVSPSSYVKLPVNKYENLINAVAFLGPIAISVDASNWHSYEGGVFDGCNQTNPDINHAVQLVGYGTDSTLGDYWLVRNSWNSNWGENGYIRIKRTSDENSRCGVDVNPLDGTACANSPPTVTVCGTCGILFDSSYPTF